MSLPGPISITYSLLDRVDASAQFGFGTTKVLASVSGPIEVRLANELPSKATFEVIVRPLSGIPGVESKAIAQNIRSILSPIFILTQNPRTLIQLVVQSLTPGRSPALIAAMINASMLALLRASSFPLRGVICAVAAGENGCFAFLFGGGGKQEEEVVWTHWRGGGVDDAREVARDAARVVYVAMKKSIQGDEEGDMEVD